METKKLYYEDAYRTEFTAKVRGCQEGPAGTYLIELDETAFYPEGGGQPADTGILKSSDGQVRVLDVHEKEGIILHTTDGPLHADAQVSGTIDWIRRFDHMQQHSGEHIVSGMICAAFDCNNVGFHMGEDIVTIDYDREISWEQCLEIERRANAYMAEDHPFIAIYPTSEELRSIEYRSKKALEGQVRITEFPGADRCACCGTHVRSSAQAMPVKFLSVRSYKGGVRMEILSGLRAVSCMEKVYDQNTKVSRILSAKPLETGEAVERIKEDLGNALHRLGELEQEIFSSRAALYREAGDVLLIEGPMEGDSLRKLCDTVQDACGGMCAVFAGEGEDYKYSVIHKGCDIKGFIKEMNTALSGRGGGRDGFAQGSVKASPEMIKSFYAGRRSL